MNPDQIQQSNPQMAEMTPEEAKASLGIATRLSEQVFNPAKSPEMAPGEEMMEETPESIQIDPEAIKEDIIKEVKDMMKEEMSSIKEMIKSALSEEDEEEE